MSASPNRSAASRAPHEILLNSFHGLSSEDVARLQDLEIRRVSVGPGQDIQGAAREGRIAYFLVEGWAISYNLLPDGTRQVLDCHLPGDLLMFRRAHVRPHESHTEPVGEGIVAEVWLNDLLEALGGGGMLSAALSWSLAREYTILSEHLVNVGRRGALERTAHFFLEMGTRLSQAGLGGPHDYDCPLSQTLLADSLGLSAVYINRTLRELRERGLLTFRQGRVSISDPKRLAEMCGFDASYLEPTPESVAGHLPAQNMNSSAAKTAAGAGGMLVSKPTSTQ